MRRYMLQAARDTWGRHFEQGDLPPTRSMLLELTALAIIEAEERVAIAKAMAGA